MLPSTSSGSLREISNWCIPQSTALHAGRIFAVAPPMFPLGLILTDSLASRRGRLCSHPYPRGRRGLPATILPILSTKGGYKIEHPPKPWRRRTSAPLRIKLRRALNFAAAFGRQNWRVSGLSSPSRARSGCLVQSTIIPQC